MKGQALQQHDVGEEALQRLYTTVINIPRHCFPFHHNLPSPHRGLGYSQAADRRSKAVLENTVNPHFGWGRQFTTFVLPEDNSTQQQQQPASICGVVQPETNAEGWVWLRRVDADTVAFAVHVRNWPNTPVKAVHIHPGECLPGACECH